MADDRHVNQIECLAHRVFPRSSRLSVERVERGVSTHVYRIRADDRVYYLRLLPQPGASFAPEVLAHRLLRQLNVRVPDIVYFEHLNEALQRSIMVTTEIEGEHIHHGLPEEAMKQIVREAGRDLAIINCISVEGFGWIKRDRAEVTSLEAEHRTYRELALKGFEEHMDLLGDSLLKGREARQIRDIVRHFDPWLDEEQGRLAHGDFDVTHIFQSGGQYTGIIDFGEMKGGNRYYDLGHFRLHDGETIPQYLLPCLLEGYRDVVPLPPDYGQRIALTSMLIGVAALARGLGRLPDYYRDHLVRAIRGDAELLSSAG